jgi:hypothetical protein
MAGPKPVELRTPAQSTDPDRARWRLNDQLGQMRRDRRALFSHRGEAHRRYINWPAARHRIGQKAGNLSPIVFGARARETTAQSEIIKNVARHVAVA